jgi:hypothetical protein
MGQPDGSVVHRSSLVGAKGMKLYVREYEADPPEISAGTVIESKRVEFSPATGGSGEKDIEDSLNSAPPLEQSVTAPPTKTAKRLNNLNIFYQYSKLLF